MTVGKNEIMEGGREIMRGKKRSEKAPGFGGYILLKLFEHLPYAIYFLKGVIKRYGG